MKAMVLTAGLGTRLRPFTEVIPKPAMPFFGKPICLYATSLLESFGVNSFTYNLHYLPEIMSSTIKENLSKPEREIHFSHEKNEILGSGGALEFCKSEFINEDIFFLANGDEILIPEKGFSIDRILKDHIDRKRLCTLICIEHQEAGKEFGGVWIDSNSSIKGFGRESITGSEQVLHYTGFAILSKRIFDYLPDGESNILYDAVTDGIQNGELVVAEKIQATWIETGNEKGFVQAHEEIIELFKKQENKYLKNYIQAIASPELDKYFQICRSSPKLNFKFINGEVIESSSWGLSFGKNVSFENVQDRCIVIANGYNIQSKSKDYKIKFIK
ncbi:MAG: NDP-sugar synthase [Bdellovibrionales bacterium]